MNPMIAKCDLLSSVNLTENISFSSYERRLFEAALNGKCGTLLERLHIAYEAAGAHLSIKQVDFELYYVYFIKGIVPPLVAAKKVKSMYDIGRIKCYHAWLRSSFTSFLGDYEYCIVDGTKGRGGSYQATIICDKNDNPYRNIIRPDVIEYVLPKYEYDVYKQFESEVLS